MANRFINIIKLTAKKYDLKFGGEDSDFYYFYDGTIGNLRVLKISKTKFTPDEVDTLENFLEYLENKMCEFVVNA